MKKIYLNVPYEEKEEAKREGAKWDPAVKKWYITQDVDIDFFVANFGEWFPEKEIVLFPPIYLGVSNLIVCWKCHQATSVYCIGAHKIQVNHPNTTICPVDFETYIANANECCSNGLILLKYANGFDVATTQFLKETSPLYKLDYSKTIQSHYYMNHCDKCGVKIGDYTVHDEVGEGFGLVSHEEAKLIKFTKTSLTQTKVKSCGFNEYWQTQNQFFSNTRIKIN